jgi:hypothetical protein
MSITLNGDTGISTPMYNGTISANAVTPSVSMKNRIINGAMVISQRGTSFASSSVSNGDYQLDRWSAWCNNGSANATVAQSSTAPAGYINSLLFTNVTAVTVGSADRAQLIQPIEGLNCTDLAWGTADAKTVTLSFWVRCSLTGQFGGSLQNSATNRSYPFSYTISAANTWEQKSITVAGDTTGTWLTTNGIGIQLNFDLGCGSTLKGTAGTWAATNYRGATGDVNLTANAVATFYITGVQLEVGSSATSFDYRQYGTELQLCQRYCSVLRAPNDNAGLCTGANYSGTNFYGTIFYPVTMRTTPSLNVAGTTSAYQVFYNNTSSNATTTPGLGQATQYSAEFIISTGGVTAGNGAFVRYGSTAGCVLTFSSEL